MEIHLESEEQWEFVEALYHYGVHYEALRKALPQWSKEKIQSLVQRCKMSAERNNKKEGESQDVKVKAFRQWVSHIAKFHLLQGTSNAIAKARDNKRKGRRSLKVVPKDQGGLLSKVMLFASEREEHPAPTSDDDPDYRQIYRYLSQVLAGEEPSQLSRGSASKVREMLVKVESMAKNSRHRKMINQYTQAHNRPLMSLSNSVPSTSSNTSSENESSEFSLFSPDDITEETEIDIEGSSKMDLHDRLEARELAELKKRQKAMISSLLNIPGINPVNFSTDLSVNSEET